MDGEPDLELPQTGLRRGRDLERNPKRAALIRADASDARHRPQRVGHQARQAFDAVQLPEFCVWRQMVQGHQPDVAYLRAEVICADDLGAQNGLQMSHEHYVKFIKPRHEKFFRQVHELSPAKLLLHTCGSVASIIDDLIEIGVDILNPVQPAAAGMNPVELKKKYRGRIAFWGGPDAQNIFPRGTVKDVKKMVENLVEGVGEGGGFVLSSCHNIQPDVPLENVLALFQHAREYIPSYAR